LPDYAVQNNPDDEDVEPLKLELYLEILLGFGRFLA
jgi:hypothetical protein